MKELVIFRSAGDGFLYYSFDNKTEPLELFQDNVFKLPYKFTSIRNLTGYKIVTIITKDGIPTYQLILPPVAIGGGGGRRSSTSSGTTVTPAYAQAYSKTQQNLAQGSSVAWDALQGALNVTLPSSTKIKMGLAGTYQFEWVLEIQSIASPA